MGHVLTILRITLHTHPRGPTEAPKATQLGSGSGWTGQAAQGSRLDDPRPSGPRTWPCARHRRPPRWHHGRRRELLRAATLLPRAAFRQLSKAASIAASDRLLPHTGCSLRSGCAMDESHGVSTHSSTLRGRGRAGKLTWASQSVGKHGAAAPALVRARTLPSAARSATLLQARRLAPPLLLERLD